MYRKLNGWLHIGPGKAPTRLPQIKSPGHSSQG